MCVCVQCIEKQAMVFLYPCFDCSCENRNGGKHISIKIVFVSGYLYVVEEEAIKADIRHFMHYIESSQSLKIIPHR